MFTDEEDQKTDVNTDRERGGISSQRVTVVGDAPQPAKSQFSSSRGTAAYAGSAAGGKYTPEQSPIRENN